MDKQAELIQYLTGRAGVVFVPDHLKEAAVELSIAGKVAINESSSGLAAKLLASGE